jgi:hypothetical protein
MKPATAKSIEDEAVPNRTSRNSKLRPGKPTRKIMETKCIITFTFFEVLNIPKIITLFTEKENAIAFEKYLKSHSGRAFAKKHF